VALAEGLARGVERGSRRLARGRLALHAAALELRHPTLGTPLRLEATLPADLLRLLDGPTRARANQERHER